jgi:hypothetical protein
MMVVLGQKLTQTQFPYHSEVGFSGSWFIDKPGRGPVYRANSDGVRQSSDGMDSPCFLRRIGALVFIGVEIRF